MWRHRNAMPRSAQQPGTPSHPNTAFPHFGESGHSLRGCLLLQGGTAPNPEGHRLLPMMPSLKTQGHLVGVCSHQNPLPDSPRGNGRARHSPNTHGTGAETSCQQWTARGQVRTLKPEAAWRYNKYLHLKSISVCVSGS